MTKTIRFVGKEFKLKYNFVWAGPSEESAIVELLNFDTQLLIERYHPANGDMRAYVYYTLLKNYPLFKKGVDNEVLQTSIPGQAY